MVLPDYTISKMLMNSFYGRLRMNPEMEKHLILWSEEAFKYYNLEPDIVPLNNGKELISLIEKDENNIFDNFNSFLNLFLYLQL
jgi:hypothetical protein